MELEDSDDDSDNDFDLQIDNSNNNNNNSGPVDTDLSQNGFSRDLLSQLKDQCKETFGKIDSLINNKGDLKEISSLGHFLKGSSSALGLPRIAYYCELIQNIALKKELKFVCSLNDDLLYQFLKQSLDCAQQEFHDTLDKLNVYYKNTL
ncbi:hypothetical protein HANVADRAFT_24163 [Hanseniaspora valbyensis NRRL Y-1626]|uniref:HPt domain-containing protein n=1 Tax=Hanseniaspora valbyensis NRRL Y-1626 TaxID=766949 RepID=A0A1B7TE31_9ASCO|nr:hypothetical protein HANVADRAFT_24163 [Hanseniaspora valbyensis NRRL Y-1626]